MASTITKGLLTLPVHWHIHVLDSAVYTKNFAQVVLIDVLRELLNHNLSIISVGSSPGQSQSHTFVLFMTGLALLLRV